MSLVAEAYIVLVVAAFNLVLGGIILAQDFRSAANRAFTIIALTIAGWGLTVGLYLLVVPDNVFYYELLPRLVYFFGISTSAAFLHFALVFDAEKPPSRVITWLIALTTAGVFAVYVFTDLVIRGPLVTPSGIKGFVFGPLRFIVDIELWGFFFIAFVIFINKYRRFAGQARLQVLVILLGTYTALAIAGTTNNTLLALGIFEYFWVGPTAVVIWTLSMAYSVARLQLFDVKVIVAEVLIFALWLIFLLRAVLSQDESDFAINIVLFVAVLVLGVFLINSVLRKVKQREQIELQDKALALVNAKQETLLHFISHEVKGYFAKSEAVFSGITEGDFGPASPSLRTMAARGLEDVRMGVSMVLSILDASSMKNGTTSYRMSLFDLKKTVAEVAEELRPRAEEKGLTYQVTGVTGAVAVVRGDEVKIRKHVIYNLIDNAILYTPAGSITIALDCTASSARLTVVDTGVGITPDDMQRLFTEGGRGREALTVNVHSTGFGLYIVKRVLDAHGASIEATSAGAGKGAQFAVEFPLAHPTT
ncbi:MAG: ATP-binding protein [Candidatus Paceibacterota bacterium]